MCEVVQFASTHLFLTIKRRYHLIKQKSQLKGIRKYFRQQGTKRQKLEKIDRFVFREFNQA
jgi:hypothetical protein